MLAFADARRLQQIPDELDEHKIAALAKKKELLGRLQRSGQCYSTAVQCVYDHDFRHLANALLVQHGAYDDFDNAGFMTLGTSRETSPSCQDRSRLPQGGNV